MPSHLNLGQRVWHIFGWQSTSPEQRPAAVGMCTAVFLHLTLSATMDTQQVLPGTQCVWQLSTFNNHLCSRSASVFSPHFSRSTPLSKTLVPFGLLQNAVRQRCCCRPEVIWTEILLDHGHVVPSTAQSHRSSGLIWPSFLILLSEVNWF